MQTVKKPYQRPELFLLAAGESASNKPNPAAIEVKLCNSETRDSASTYVPIQRTQGSCPQGTRGSFGVAS